MCGRRGSNTSINSVRVGMGMGMGMSRRDMFYVGEKRSPSPFFPCLLSIFLTITIIIIIHSFIIALSSSVMTVSSSEGVCLVLARDPIIISKKKGTKEKKRLRPYLIFVLSPNFVLLGRVVLVADSYE